MLGRRSTDHQNSPPRQSSQRTTIRPRTPGSGKDSASASTASRAARERRRQVWTVIVPFARRHVPTSSPSTRRPPGHTRGVQSSPRRSASGTRSSRSSPMEQEVGVAAREEPCGRHGPRSGAERRLVAREDPRVAERCSHRGQRPAERVERRAALPCGDPRPPANASGVVGPKTCRYRRASSRRASRGSTSGWRHRPDGRLPGAVPPDHDRAGRCGVPEPSWGVRRARGPPRRRSSSRHRGGRAGGRPDPPPSAGRRRRPAASRARRPRGRVPRRRTRWYRGPQSWTSDGSSQVDGSVPSTRAWIERSAARGMLSCRPAHAARRSERRPRGSRSSSAPTCRRNARICGRVRSSRDLVTSRFTWSGLSGSLAGRSVGGGGFEPP